MYRVITNITIGQQPSATWPNRKTTLLFDFCNEYECEDSWDDMTNKGRVVLPKNVYVRDQNNKLISLGTAFGGPASNVNIGGFSTAAPLLLRGDKITINSGYKYFNNAGIEILDTHDLFQGYISQVTSKKPLEFNCEDNMWKLKQIPAPIMTFPKGTSLESILSRLLQGSGFTVNATTSTTFGEFSTGNETVAETLARLRKLFHFESYFRGTELRCGSIVYLPGEAVANTFAFQQNIIEDELEYRRKDDITLSAVARNTIEEQTGGVTHDGQPKTKKIRLEVLVTFRPDGTITQFIKTKGQDYPPNTGGERRDLIFLGATSIAQLAQLAQDELQKYYYTGYRGKFTTFGIPYVKQGDNVVIQDPILPERNGTYRVKKVQYSGSPDSGLRQEITLDFKIS